MMTGPEHYVNAQIWLFKAKNKDARGDSETPEFCVDISHLHAMLAMAAATALNGHSELPMKDQSEWFKVASEHEKGTNNDGKA